MGFDPAISTDSTPISGPLPTPERTHPNMDEQIHAVSVTRFESVQTSSDGNLDIGQALEELDRSLEAIELFVGENSKELPELNKENEEVAGQIIDEHFTPKAEKARALVKKVQVISKKSGVAAGAFATSLNTASANHSKAWKLYRALLRYLPGGLGRRFSLFAVKDNRIQISQVVEANLVHKLSPRLIRLLSPDQLRGMTPQNISKLNSQQLFAIGPKLKAMGASNMAHIINNRLLPDAKTNYMADIARQWKQGQVEAVLVKRLFSLLTIEDIESFLTYLKASDSALYNEIHPLVLGSLDASHFQKMSEEHLKDIEPEHLGQMSAQNMGYLIANKLNEDDADELLLGIIERYDDGELEGRLVADLLQAIGVKKKEAFLLALKDQDFELFAKIYPLAFQKIVEGYPLLELLAEKSFVQMKTGLKVTNSAGEEETLFPLSIFNRDAIAETYTFNGIDIDPIYPEGKPSPQVVYNDSSMPRPDFALEQLYIAAGKNGALTSKVQLLINQGTLAAPTQSLLDNYTLGANLGFSVLGTHYYVDIVLPDPLNPNDTGMVNVKIENPVEILEPSTRFSLGFLQMQTAIAIRIGDLLAGEGKNGSMTCMFSRVMPTREELEEITTEKPKKSQFGTVQSKLKDELKKAYSDAVAIEYVAQRISIDNNVTRSSEINSVKILMRDNESLSLEELQEASNAASSKLDVINEIVENLFSQENDGKSTEEIADSVFDGIREVHALGFPEASYGIDLKDPSLRDFMIRRDCETVQNILLEEMKLYENEILTSTEKQEIKASVIDSLKELDAEAKVQIDAFNDELMEDSALIDRFKKDLFSIMKEVLLQPTKEQQQELFQEKITKLKQEFQLEEFRKGEGHPVEDLMELCLGDLVNHFGSDINYAAAKKKNVDSAIKARIDERFDSSKLALYENAIYFPERAENYANILMDRFFRIREAYF